MISNETIACVLKIVISVALKRKFSVRNFDLGILKFLFKSPFHFLIQAKNISNFVNPKFKQKCNHRKAHGN